MVQREVWEREYQKPKLLTKESEPQKDVLRFLKFLRRDEHIPLEGIRVLDLGSGTGRNANYLATLGCQVAGLEISRTAHNLAVERSRKMGVRVDYRLQSIGTAYPYPNAHFDVVLDVMSSNSLTSSERRVYLGEVHRVLKSEGYCFVKALSKEGDHNAKALLKLRPGPEPDTYVMPGLGLTERVFDRQSFLSLYTPLFKMLELSKKTNYQEIANQHYRRNYFLAYLQKP